MQTMNAPISHSGLPRNFVAGQVWRPRRGTHRDGWHDWKIAVITDHPTCPVVAQDSVGAVRSFGLNGHFDGDADEGDLDLVTLVSDVPNDCAFTDAEHPEAVDA
jgi:hypothetical protein